MKAVNTYLNFPGNAEEAFNFYKSVFGGEFVGLTRYSDIPEVVKVKPNENEKLMHVSLPVGKDNVLMATDALESTGGQLITGTNFHISITADSKEEATNVFNGLSKGGKVTMPLADTFWGDYFGMLTDKYDIQWMINYTYPKEK